MNQVFPLSSAARVLLPGYEIDLSREELRSLAGERVELRPRSFAVLRLLATNLGRLVTKDEIMQKVWDDSVVTEDSLTQCIADIRRAIRDDERKVVRTVPRRGYMLIADNTVGTAILERTDIDSIIGQSLAPIDAKRTDGRRKALWVAGGILLSLVLLGGGGALYQFSSQHVAPQHRTDAGRGPSVGVMPFENLTGDSRQDTLTDEIGRDLIAALSRFQELRVLAREMTAGFRGQPVSPTDLNRSLNVDYIIEGSVRQTDGQTRVSVQLIDSGSGVQVWAGAYEPKAATLDGRPFQEQIASRVSASVGTWTGAIAASELKKTQNKAAAVLTSYECMIVANSAAFQQVSNESVRRALECLKVTLDREPRNAAAWAALAWIFTIQRQWGLALEPPQSLDLDKRAYLAGRSVEAAGHAIELAPNDPYARLAAARAYYAVCNRDLLRIEAERSLALNPYDPSAMGSFGTYLGNSGLWEVGRPLAEKAIALTEPGNPRWWWWVVAKDFWFRGDYANALDRFQRAYVEQVWLSHLQMAYTLPFLDRTDEANAHVDTLLQMRPGFTITMADAYYKMWCFEPAYREKMKGALRLTKLPE